MQSSQRKRAKDRLGNWTFHIVCLWLDDVIRVRSMLDMGIGSEIIEEALQTQMNREAEE